jgi:uncharacterized cupin superfamily protein
MERVSADDVDSRTSPAAAKRPLGRALGAEEVAVNHYELEPGDAFGFGYHRHPDQAELFYVIGGEATFETEDGDVTVGAGEAVRFAPGEWQLGRNEGDERVVALALGAPADEAGADIRRECQDCGERTTVSIERADSGSGLVTVCQTCAAVTGRFS